VAGSTGHGTSDGGDKIELYGVDNPIPVYKKPAT